MTCASDEEHQHRGLYGMSQQSTRVGWCSINYLGGFITDETRKNYISNFVSYQLWEYCLGLGWKLAFKVFPASQPGNTLSAVRHTFAPNKACMMYNRQGNA